MYTCYFGQRFTVSFKLSLIFAILFFTQFNGLFRYIKMKIYRGFQPVFTSMVNALPSFKDVQSAVGLEQKNGCYHEYFCCTKSTNFSLQRKLVRTTATAFLFTWLALSRIANTRQPVASKLSYKHNTCGQLLYTLTACF